MPLRNHYACACGHVWAVTAEDVVEGECSECGKLGWPAELIEVDREELFEPAGEPHPHVNIPQKAYDDFARVAQSTPSLAPTIPAEPIPSPAPPPQTQLDLFGGADE